MVVGINDRAHISVCRFVRATLGSQRAGITRGAQRRFEGAAPHVVPEHELGHGLEHRQFDVLGLTGAEAVKQGGEYRRNGVQPDRAVVERDGNILRLWRTGLHKQGRHGRESLNQIFVYRSASVGASFAEPDQADRDQLRVKGFHFLGG